MKVYEYNEWFIEYSDNSTGYEVHKPDGSLWASYCYLDMAKEVLRREFLNSIQGGAK
jgi:hypothetical protein